MTLWKRTDDQLLLILVIERKSQNSLVLRLTQSLRVLSGHWGPEPPVPAT